MCLDRDRSHSPVQVFLVWGKPQGGPNAITATRALLPTPHSERTLSRGRVLKVLWSKVEQTPIRMHMGIWNVHMKCMHHKVSGTTLLLNLYLAERF